MRQQKKIINNDIQGGRFVKAKEHRQQSRWCTQDSINTSAFAEVISAASISLSPSEHHTVGPELGLLRTGFLVLLCLSLSDGSDQVPERLVDVLGDLGRCLQVCHCPPLRGQLLALLCRNLSPIIQVTLVARCDDTRVQREAGEAYSRLDQQHDRR